MGCAASVPAPGGGADTQLGSCGFLNTPLLPQRQVSSTSGSAANGHSNSLAAAGGPGLNAQNLDAHGAPKDGMHSHSHQLKGDHSYAPPSDDRFKTSTTTGSSAERHHDDVDSTLISHRLLNVLINSAYDF